MRDILWVLALETAVSDPDLFTEVARHVPLGSSLLDLACGKAPLLDRLPADIAYLGLDRSEANIEACRRLHAGRARAAFDGLDHADLGRERFDTVTLLGFPGPDLAELLRRARLSIRPGGRLIVAHHDGSGWSLEGVVALLSHLSCGRVLEARRLEGGAAYLVAAAI